MDLELLVNVPDEEEITERHSVKGFKFGLKKYNGRYLLNLMNNISCIKNIQLRDDDVFVIGFPKSGTTWTEDICWLIQNDLNYELFVDILHGYRIPYIDMGIKNDILDALDSPRTFKSHLTLDFLPEGTGTKTKIVYCVRNPKDLVVSAYHFFQSIVPDKFEGSFEDYYNAFLEGTVGYGPWWSHIDHYINNPNVHVIFYENLLKNRLENLRNLSKYLGKEYTDEQLRELAVFTSFDNLKKLSKEYYDEWKKANMATEDINMYRKGEIGNWRSYFTPEMSDRFDEIIKQKLKYSGTFDYGEEPENQRQNA